MQLTKEEEEEEEEDPPPPLVMLPLQKFGTGMPHSYRGAYQAQTSW